MTGEELAAAIERLLPAIRLLKRIPAVGFDFPPGDKVRITVDGSSNAIRQSRHRQREALRKRNESVTDTVTESVTEALRALPHTPSDLSKSSGSDPDPDFSLPASSEENLTGSAGAREIAEAPRKKRAARVRQIRTATPWPEGSNWSPELAAKLRSAGIDPDDENDNMRDYALREGVTHKDWEAARRMWVRRAPGFKRPVNGYAKPDGAVEHERHELRPSERQYIERMRTKEQAKRNEQQRLEDEKKRQLALLAKVPDA